VEEILGEERRAGWAGGRLLAERAGRWYFFRPTAIDFVEANGNYVNLAVGTHRYIRRDTFKRLHTALSGVGFVRIRRNLLVNLDRVECAEKLPRGVVAFHFPGGQHVLSAVGCRLDALLTHTVSEGCDRGFFPDTA
jgi:DNA-binding LytR/AlgR family response regulator